MSLAFNLIDQPWLPSIDRKGEIQELGLLQTLLAADELREIRGDTPLETASLYRLLLVILHRIFGPQDYGTWGVLWKAGRFPPEPLETYSDRWRHRFDLFHPQRPFYQAPDARVKPKSIINLIPHLASGNNPTLFDHHSEATGAALTAAQAARCVVTAQSFGLAGLSGLPQKFTDAPCTRGVIFLVEGNNLFETLMLNLVRYPDDNVVATLPQRDHPSWEMDDPFNPERSKPFGYLDYLTWQNRRMLLFPEQHPDGVWVRTMTVAPALRLDSEARDPMKHYTRDEQRGFRVLRFQEDRDLWRNSAALFRLQTTGEAYPPSSFRWLAELANADFLDDRSVRLRYIALGMANDKAKVYFYRHERMPLPLPYLQNPKFVEQLSIALEVAEATGRQLWGALKSMAAFHLAPESDLAEAHQPASADCSNLTQHWGVERRFWGELELPFHNLLQDLPYKGESATEEWRRTVRNCARSAFQQAVDLLGSGVRGLKAGVKARGQLEAGLAKVFQQEESNR